MFCVSPTFVKSSTRSVSPTRIIPSKCPDILLQNKIISDPDNKIKYWNVFNFDDYEIISKIEKTGSIQVYSNAKSENNLYLLDNLYSVGFRVTPKEVVISAATNSKLGNNTVSLFTTMLDMFFTDLTVIGDCENSFDQQCFDTFYVNGSSNCPKFKEWIDSMLKLVKSCESNYYLLAHFKYTREIIQKLVISLFPDIKVIYNKGNIVISILELKKFII